MTKKYFNNSAKDIGRRK